MPKDGNWHKPLKRNAHFHLHVLLAIFDGVIADCTIVEEISNA